MLPESACSAPAIDLDERRLAGAVLAQERVHLAWLDGQLDALEGLDAGVALADVDDLEQVAHRRLSRGRMRVVRGGQRVGQERHGVHGPGAPAAGMAVGSSGTMANASSGTMANARPGAPLPPSSSSGANTKKAPSCGNCPQVREALEEDEPGAQARDMQWLAVRARPRRWAHPCRGSAHRASATSRASSGLGAGHPLARLVTMTSWQ